MRQTRERPAESRAWSYIAGEKGRNRVRVYERAGFGIWIDYRDSDGKRVRHPLNLDDRDRAKLKADEVAAGFRRSELRPRAVTLRSLFDIYEREKTPQKGATSRKHDARTLPLLLKAFGPNRSPCSLNVRDWDAYIRRRRSGELAAAGREGIPVRTRVLEQDCNLIRAVLNWAVRAGDGHGGYLADRNPFAGLTVPREDCPKRAVLSLEQFALVRAAAKRHSDRLECFVVLAWFTGHRAGSIRQLRWSDVDADGGRIHWRGENDKIDYDHWNPLHADALVILRRERALGASGDDWIFPAARDKSRPLSGDATFNLWKRLATAAGIPKGERYGWHSCRRAFANTLRDVPLRDLKDLGGWKTERTVVSIYQQPSESAQRAALSSLAAPAGPATGTTNGHSPRAGRRRTKPRRARNARRGLGLAQKG